MSAHWFQREAWTICRWHEAPAFALPAWGLDETAVLQILRGLDADLLRRTAGALDLHALDRTHHARLVQQLAGHVMAGTLRLVPPGAAAGLAAEGDDESLRQEQRLLRRLRLTSHVFAFEGERLRIVAARVWGELRGSDDENRYVVIPHAQALPLLQRVAASLALPADEARAVAEAAPLLATEWRTRQSAEGQPRQPTTGLLLIRVVDRVWNTADAGDAAAITPSQLTSAPEKPEHFVQVELLDDDDKPVPDQPWRIELPDGSIREGRLDRNGQAYIGGLPAGGSFKLAFPQIDTQEWHAA